MDVSATAVPAPVDRLARARNRIGGVPGAREAAVACSRIREAGRTDGMDGCASLVVASVGVEVRFPDWRG